MKIKNLFVKRGQGEYASVQAQIPTKSGKLYLSLVAGQGLYSTPRKYLVDRDYAEVEVAVFNMETNSWASYNEVKPIFDIIGKGEYEYSDESDDPKCAVFGYVDIELIEKCLEIL